MISTLLPNGRHSILPSVPSNGQIFIDSDFVQWVFNAANDAWDRIGAVNAVPLATSSTDGFVSPHDKELLDNIPAIGGGFGIITSQRLLLQSPTNPEGVLTGNIKLLSESLDITCVSGDQTEILTPLNCAPSNFVSHTSFPGLSFKLSDKFINTMILNFPGSQGDRGVKGDKGPTGENGFGDGPVGFTGPIGDTIDTRCEFTGFTYEELVGITDTGLVKVDLSADCKMILTKAKLNVPGNVPADKVMATPLSRSVVYDPDDTNCNSPRIKNWVLMKPPTDQTPLNLQLLRLAKGSNSGDAAIMFNGNMSLSDFVTDVVEYYHNILLKLDADWSIEAKKYIEGIDSKARTILSDLANQLSQCEFNLPAVEYCITLTDCPEDSTAQSFTSDIINDRIISS